MYARKTTTAERVTIKGSDLYQNLIGFLVAHLRTIKDVSFPNVVRADLKSSHLVTKHCPLLPWISGVAAGVLVGSD